MEDKKILAKEELIGLYVKVVECKDSSWVGKSGFIIDETKNTFVIENEDKKKVISKKAAIFEFDYQGKKITLEGSKIIYKPEDRIKKVR